MIHVRWSSTTWTIFCHLIIITHAQISRETCKTDLSVEGLQGDVFHNFCTLHPRSRVSLTVTCRQDRSECRYPKSLDLDLCTDESIPSPRVTLFNEDGYANSGRLSLELSLVMVDQGGPKLLDAFQIHINGNSHTEDTQIEAVGRSRQTRMHLGIHRTCSAASAILLDRQRRENRDFKIPIVLNLEDVLDSEIDKKDEAVFFSGDGEQAPPSLEDMVKESLHKLKKQMSIPNEHNIAKADPVTVAPAYTMVVTDGSETSTHTSSFSPTIQHLPSVVVTEDKDTSAIVPGKKDSTEKSKYLKSLSSLSVIRKQHKLSSQNLLKKYDSPANSSPEIAQPVISLKTTKINNLLPITNENEETKSQEYANKVFEVAAQEFQPVMVQEVNDRDFLDRLLESIKNSANETSPEGQSKPVILSKPQVPTTPVIPVPNGVKKPSVRSLDTGSESEADSNSTSPEIPVGATGTSATITSTTAAIATSSTPSSSSFSTSSQQTESTTMPSTTFTTQTPETTETTDGDGTNISSTQGGSTVSQGTESSTAAGISVQSTDGETTSFLTSDVTRTTSTTEPTSTSISTATTETTNSADSTVSSSFQATTTVPSTVSTVTTTASSTIESATSTPSTTDSTISTTDSTTASTTPSTTQTSQSTVERVTSTTPGVPSKPSTKETTRETTTPKQTQQTDAQTTTLKSTNVESTTIPTTSTKDLTSGQTPGPLLASSSETKDMNMNGDTSDETFWPIVAALVIGIPSIIVFGIAITVIHKRRKIDTSRAFYLGGKHHRHSIDV